MCPTSRDHFTAILLQVDGRETGDAPLDRILPVVYDQLHAMAARRLRAEGRAHTVSPTELVHEAYIRMADATRVTAHGRAYFFAAAAQAMRRILVDHARRRGRLKRGGGMHAITLDETAVLTAGADLNVLDLERGLERLETVAARAARVVECRFYGGLSIEDTALALGTTNRTVNRDWQFARAWLYDFLETGVREDTS